jgi:hypothetical protein
MNEAKIQFEVFQWFNNNHCLKHHNPRGLIFSIPNGGTRNLREAMALKSTGLLPGASDLVLIFDKKILFLELKTELGKQSPHQKEFEERIIQNGFNYQIAYSTTEAIEKIKAFLYL